MKDLNNVDWVPTLFPAKTNHEEAPGPLVRSTHVPVFCTEKGMVKIFS